MNMKIAVLLLPLFLIGCGGDDDDDSQVNTPVPNTDSNPSLSLVAKKGHDFSTNYNVDFSVNLPPVSEYFLMVYSEYKTDDVTGNIVPTVSSKILNVKLDNGTFTSKLHLGKQTSSVLVQVLSTSGNPNDSFSRVINTYPDAILDIN
jgi:hypothetical protein